MTCAVFNRVFARIVGVLVVAVRVAAVAGALVLAAVTASGCAPVSGREAGEAVFHDPRVSRSAFNAVACATCHDDGDAPPGTIFSGLPLTDVVFRSSWWGGQAATLKDAVDHCLVRFLRETPLEAADPRGRALYEYLLSISSPTPQAGRPLTIVENVTTLGRGDPRRGEDVWNRACATCHGAAFTGEGRISDLASVVPGDSVDFATTSGFPLELVIIEKVRHGSFFAVGGSMPPYALEVLGDDQLRDLIGYLVPAP